MFRYWILSLLCCFSAVASQDPVRWCTKNTKELEKCRELNEKLKDVAGNEWRVECTIGRDYYDCLELMHNDEVDIVNLDAGFAYAEQSRGSTPTIVLAAEEYPNTGSDKSNIYSVAVIKKESGIVAPQQLQGKELCSSGIGENAGWILPLAELAQTEILNTQECGVNVQTASSFFGSMCAPGALNSYNNPFGDNSVSTCELCGSQRNGLDWCTYKDKYAGGRGPMLCLKETDADVAFMRSIDLEYISSPQNGEPAEFNRNDYKLLCSQGGTKPIELSSYPTCFWGSSKGNVFVTSAARSTTRRTDLKNFLNYISTNYPPTAGVPVVTVAPATDMPIDTNDTTTPAPTTTTVSPPGYTIFNTNIAKYGMNSLVSNGAISINTALSTDRIYAFIDGAKHQALLDKLGSCSVGSVRICVVSEYEMYKCEQMVLALRSKNLKPDLDCIRDDSTRSCMQKIADDDADIINLDAGDQYEAGKHFGLIPIAYEDYGDTGGFYYAVAVARKIESHLTLFNLIARNSCHGSMRSATGWIYPILSLMETGQISPKQCEAIKRVGELFRRSCVPGILDTEYNSAGTNPVNLCENCAAGGMDKCQRNTRELYYGDSGAFRCLVEFGGDIAYTRHMTPRDNTDGRNSDFWARNRRSDDYELLCKDGKRERIENWRDCYLAKVPGRALMTAGFKGEKTKRIYWNLLNYAQQFFSSDYDPYFQMFDSGFGQTDLLFSDSTVRLVQLNASNQDYETYLGTSFIKAVNTLNQFDCTSASPYTHSSFLVILVTLIVKQMI